MSTCPVRPRNAVYRFWAVNKILAMEPTCRCCLITEPHLARLSRLCKRWPRPCSRCVPAGSGVFAFSQEFTCVTDPIPYCSSWHHCNTRPNPGSTTGNIRRVPTIYFGYWSARVWLRHPTLIDLSPHLTRENDMHLLRDYSIHVPSRTLYCGWDLENLGGYDLCKSIISCHTYYDLLSCCFLLHQLMSPAQRTIVYCMYALFCCSTATSWAACSVMCRERITLLLLVLCCCSCLLTDCRCCWNFIYPCWLLAAATVGIYSVSYHP